MARHARLVAPAAQPSQDWPWHTAKWASMPLHDMWGGDRRLEAENYLSSGYCLRLSIERKASGWQRLGTLAKVWQPLRLKGIQVGAQDGTPFLAATQVFDIRPIARKWLAVERTSHVSGRYVQPGQILVTCSGAVGRATLAHAPHENTLISHDLLRVDAQTSGQHGWLYAYLRAPQTRAMMSGAQYGHIIKHLEVSHLEALPVPDVDIETSSVFERRVNRLLELRNQSYHHTLRAEQLFEQALGPIKVKQPEAGFVTKASQFSNGRRRLEASFHAPLPAAMLARIHDIGTATPLGEVCDRVLWLNRFKRVFGEGGIPYVSADELFSINAIETKRILIDPEEPKDEFRVGAGWIVMARSGQVYGLNGSAMLMTAHHEEQFISDDLIRIIPTISKIRPGYLVTALTHPTLGRPLVIRAAYGTSIPHLDPADVREIPIVRFDLATETAIANHAEAAAADRAEAHALERELAQDAGQLIEQFIAGGNLSSMRAATSPLKAVPKRTAVFAEHARVRLRESLPEHRLKAGVSGTVVHVYGRGEGLEVEFGASGKAPKVVTLKSSAVEPLTD